MNNILYCFISHQPHMEQDAIIIGDQMKTLDHSNYIIVYGGKKVITNDSHIKHIPCRDDYCGLPEKINKTFKYVVNNINYNFLVKFDRSIVVKKIFDVKNLTDYCGVINRYVNCRWHFNKCIKDSFWYNKDFEFPSIEYALGLGYSLSKKSVQHIANDDKCYKSHVYEDVYIAHLLLQHNIRPEHFNFDINDYFYDPNHTKLF